MTFNLTIRITFILGLLSIGSYAGVIAPKASAQGADLDKQNSEILLYLPIHQNQFPGLIEQLNIAIENSQADYIKVITTDYWHPYQNGIRQGRSGIYFAAPHFSAWLVNKHQFIPSLALSGKLQYVIAARRSDSDIFEVRDLANKTVCTNATMDLSFILVRESMSRSILAAQTKIVQDVANEMRVDNKACDAFSLSEHLFLEFASKDPYQFIRLQQSNEFSNYAYVISPDTSPKAVTTVKHFLSSKEVKKILHPMYRLYSQEPAIVNSSADRYPIEQMAPLTTYWSADAP